MDRALGGAAFQGDALTYLQSVYRDQTQPDGVRLDAAKACMPFEVPRLNAIDARILTQQYGGMALSASEMLALAATFDEAALEGEAVEVPAERGER